jgi:hypothetical protein
MNTSGVSQESYVISQGVVRHQRWWCIGLNLTTASASTHIKIRFKCIGINNDLLSQDLYAPMFL